jgi:histidinol phosphatase-like PHP family hydrolase
MRYIVDHDYHIHSMLSSCSNDPAQTTNVILDYAVRNGFSDICLTDHFWDDAVPGSSDWYRSQDLTHVSQALPLPQTGDIFFHFGCETDMDKFCTLGISMSYMEKFEFVIISTTHLHMEGFTIDNGVDSFEERARIYVNRLDALLSMDLPFRKTGIAHLTTSNIFRSDPLNHIKVLEHISNNTFAKLFSKAGRLGVGIELNFPSFSYSADGLEKILRPYRIAKDQKCKFYLGSDAHHPDAFVNAKVNFDHIVDLLDLSEEDKFRFVVFAEPKQSFS